MAIVLSGTTGIDAGSLPVANTGKISAGSGLPVILNTAGVDRVTVDTAGDVGIGVTPAARLDVNGISRIRRQNVLDTYLDIIVSDINVNYSGYDPDGYMNHQWSSNGSTKMLLSGSGNLLLTSGTGGLGYGTGAGGTVTQLTSKSTAVTLNKPCGQITMNNAALAAGASVTFILNNTTLLFHDRLVVNGTWGLINPQLYRIECAGVWAGVGAIRVTNLTAGSLSEAIDIEFSIIKGAIA